MNTSHTPVPWNISKHGTPEAFPQFGIYSGEKNDHVIVKGDKAEADARLIAAAPDLLAALQRLSFAASCRDNTSGDAIRVMETRAELAEANRQAMASIAQATV